jgi:hypothetical protein
LTDVRQADDALVCGRDRGRLDRHHPPRASVDHDPIADLDPRVVEDADLIVAVDAPEDDFVPHPAGVGIQTLWSGWCENEHRIDSSALRLLNRDNAPLVAAWRRALPVRQRQLDAVTESERVTRAKLATAAILDPKVVHPLLEADTD